MSAAPFDTGYITWWQPDSTSFTARYWGDEFIWWMQTQSGYSIIQGSDGWYYYAKLGTNGDFVPDTLKVGINSPPSYSHQLERSTAYMDTVYARIARADSQIALAGQWFAQKQAAAGANPVVLKLGVIFVEFADVKHYNPNVFPRLGGYLKSDFDSMMFSQNYWIADSGNNKHPEGDQIFGSFRDYYYQMSRGKLILTGTLLNPADSNGVPQWITIGQRALYGYPSEIMKGDALTKYLQMRQADPTHWPDTAGYDRFIFIYAQNDDIRGRITFAAEDNTFIQVPERMGVALLGSENIAFAHMGTYAHEFGHNIGFKDQYKSTSDLTYTDLFNYDLMAWGIFNGPQYKGECPATLAPFSRIRKNWITSILLTRDTTNFIVGYDFSNPQIYRINPIEATTPDEHYLIETKLREGFDKHIPNSPDHYLNQTGTLLVWHHYAAANIPGGRKIDSASIKFADNTPGNSSTDFFPNNNYSQDLNDTSTPGATISFNRNYDPDDPDIGNKERPAHFALNGIHKLSNGSTQINSISLRLPFSQNTTWRDLVYVRDNLTVQSGVTLTILPGTKVMFDPGKKLTVYGKLIAEGTSSNRITFTSSNPTPSPGSWWGIRCLGGGPHTLTYCDIKYARVGLELDDQTPLLNYMAYDTISQSQYEGVYVQSNSTDHAALKLDHCVLKNNGGDGVFATNAIVHISYSRIEGNGTQNWGSGIYTSNNGKIYLDHSRVQSNLLSGAEVSGSGSRIALSADEISHGYNTFEQHGMSELYIYNDASALLGYTYVQTCDCGEATPIKGHSPIYGVNSVPEPECPEGCDPVYIVHAYAGWNNVYNTYNYPGRLINNETNATIPARYNYWGSGSNMFIGNVDTTYQLSSPINTPAKTQIKDYFAEGYQTNQSRANILQWLRQLRKDIEGNKENAVDALHQFALHAGPGGKYTEALSARWEDFLAALENSPKIIRAKKLATVFRLQAKQDQGEYANAITMADQVLKKNNIDDNMWFYCQSRKVFAAVGLGDIAAARSYYNAMRSRGEQIDRKATDALGRYIALATESFKSGYGRDGSAANPAKEMISSLPKSYALEQNYPNPFNPTTTIRYSLPQDAEVTLKIYNVLGQEVKTLIDDTQAAGYKIAEFNTNTLASGVYFYRLEATGIGEVKNNFTQVKKMLLIR
jgi:M6 family metalloprotease-like protein